MSVADGNVLDTELWPGRKGEYRIDCYLTSENPSIFRYGYTITGPDATTERDGFASADQAVAHAILVCKTHDREVSHMNSPF